MKIILTIKLLLLCSLLFFSQSYVLSHHNTGTYFDTSQTIELKVATAISFQVVNPHTKLLFVLNDSEGNEVEWWGATASANHLRRVGITNDLISSGDKITVKGYPSKTTDNLLFVTTVIFENGDYADFNYTAGGIFKSVTY
ncbi:MAG: hypothetical protein CBC38_01550 [Gammaproteobacteria bacterium TMED78]|nr:MAG: hypothetical protein CBC38_01550 [Gammaproteobacteria bacterium TMED78]|tara:strand:- start:20156 stop:20578 length:423 start_codon:yes stop_codon:yes gene_type:complete